MRKKEKTEMKTFVKTITVGNFYNYCIYKITDWVGRTYYVAEPILHGVTRTAETEETLKAILEKDVGPINSFIQHVR